MGTIQRLLDIHQEPRSAKTKTVFVHIVEGLEDGTHIPRIHGYDDPERQRDGYEKACEHFELVELTWHDDEEHIQNEKTKQAMEEAKVVNGDPESKRYSKIKEKTI